MLNAYINKLYQLKMYMYFGCDWSTIDCNSDQTFDQVSIDFELALPAFSTGNDMKNRKWHHKITKIKLYLMDKIVIISIEFGPSRRILWLSFVLPRIWTARCLLKWKHALPIFTSVNFHEFSSPASHGTAWYYHPKFFRTSPSPCLTSDHNRHLISRFIKRSQIRPVFDPLSPNRRHQTA